jgi:uncharacterized protein YjbJ (UPF0337 family)
VRDVLVRLSRAPAAIRLHVCGAAAAGSRGSRATTGATTKGPPVSGEKDQAKGRVKQAVGDLTDDNDLKREGKVDETAGKVKDGVDKLKDKLTGKD